MYALFFVMVLGCGGYDLEEVDINPPETTTETIKTPPTI